MVKQLEPRQRAALVQDVLKSERDVIALAEAHNLSPDDLAAWASEPATRRCLRGLRELADAQTQMLVSRYRLLAAERLIRLATGGDAEADPGGKAADAARRACVDLLKLDVANTEADPADDGNNDNDAASLRALLYEECKPQMNTDEHG